MAQIQIMQERRPDKMDRALHSASMWRQHRYVKRRGQSGKAGRPMQLLRRHAGEACISVRAQGLTNTTQTLVAVVPELGSQLDDDPDTDGEQAHSTDGGHDLLDVGHILGAANERSCTAEEGVDARGVHQGLALSLLDRGS